MSGGVVDTSGPAYPLVTTDNNDVVAGAQDYGYGRVVLISDVDMFGGSYFDDDDNLQFAVNIANWLTSYSAQVLVYADTASHDPNNNVYRGPVANALNELGISFYLTYSGSYFNLSLNTETWDLVIFDNINWWMDMYST